MTRLLILFALAGHSLFAAAQAPIAESESVKFEPTKRAHVVIVHDPAATQAFNALPRKVQEMIERGITHYTGKKGVAEAWGSLVSVKDTVGIKVYSAPGGNTGTHPSVVAAVVEGLLSARIPATQIIVWDKRLVDLRAAGFLELADRYGIRLASSAAVGWDASEAYTNNILGTLVWGDLEFDRKEEESLGRNSFVSKLITKEITKIINVSPLLNHNFAGVAGNLFGLAMGSVDNTIRFDQDTARLATALPEIYAMPTLGDKVVLNIVDALICQYEGGPRTLLQYSTVLNQLRFSTDPVALDVLSLQELSRWRRNESNLTNYMGIYQNASLLELGLSDPKRIQVELVSPEDR
jgi:hypothetical protein